MIDVNKQIKLLVKTGKVDFGCGRAVSAAKSGRGKLVIVASNCPDAFKTAISSNARLSNLPVYTYAGTSRDLGTACEKPFVIAALTVKEPGDSEILKLAEQPHVSA